MYQVTTMFMTMTINAKSAREAKLIAVGYDKNAVKSCKAKKIA